MTEPLYLSSEPGWKATVQPGSVSVSPKLSTW